MNIQSNIIVVFPYVLTCFAIRFFYPVEK